MEEKIKLAEEAIKLIEPNDTIILESSTTVFELGKKLLQYPDLLKTLIIITNSVRILNLYDTCSYRPRIFFLGGWVQKEENSTTGTYTGNSLKSFQAEKSFISRAAVNEKFILSGYYDDDIELQKQMIESSNTSILLFDDSKYPKNGIIPLCHISEFDHIITNVKLPRK